MDYDDLPIFLWALWYAASNACLSPCFEGLRLISVFDMLFLYFPVWEIPEIWEVTIGEDGV